MNMRADDRSKGRTYRFYRGDAVVYEFGSGFGYASFGYEAQNLDANGLSVDIEIKNEGNVDSDHTILAFVKSQDETVVLNPVKSLKAFQRFAGIKAGGSQVATFQFQKEDVGALGENGEFVQGKGAWTVQFDKGDGDVVDVVFDLD